MYEIYRKPLEKDAELIIIRLCVPYEQEKIEKIRTQMANIVNEITGGNIGNEFVEIHPDMPNIRVVIRNLNSLNFHVIQ